MEVLVERPAKVSNPMESDRAGLAVLPFEILRQIVWDEALDQEDVAALRLSCRGLLGPASSRLFYCISISKLNWDRESFLSICHNPQLAVYVHEVEWQEISWDTELFDRISAPMYWSDFSNHADFMADADFVDDNEDLTRLLAYMRSDAKEAFWMRSAPARPLSGDAIEEASRFEDMEKERQQAVAAFKDDFEAAIDLLPNLHTFVSGPMNTARVINDPESEYPLEAGMFQRFQDLVDRREDGWNGRTQTNDGLFLFLFPAMERVGSTVTRLRWADEFPGCSFFRTFSPVAFKYLESIELCFNRSSDGELDHMRHFKEAYFHAAPILRHFKLCLDHGKGISSSGTVGDILLTQCLGNPPRLSGLRSLALHAVAIELADFTRLIESHADSLRHLDLNEVSIDAPVINALRTSPKLFDLRTISIVHSGSSNQVCPYALVRYINEGDHSRPCPMAAKAVKRGNIWCDEWDIGNGASCHGTCAEKLRCALQNDSYRLSTWPHEVDETWTRWSKPPSRPVSPSSDADSLDMRESPYWAWDVFHGESVYCYRVDQPHPKQHPTVIWKFTSRDGTFALGKDPLNWWEEWDTDAGDVEEPTPFCDALDDFFADVQDALYRGIEIRQREGHPPEGAILYQGKRKWES